MSTNLPLDEQPADEIAARYLRRGMRFRFDDQTVLTVARVVALRDNHYRVSFNETDRTFDLDWIDTLTILRDDDA